MQASAKRGLYQLHATPAIHQDQAMAAIDINVLHRRMGHIGIDRLQRMVTKGQLKDIDTVLGSPQLCEPCVLGKLKKLPFKHEESQRTTRPLERVHSDVGGPVDIRSREGYSY
ncbi:hypothetical protein SCHPADRAFT_835724, partial [Schizopora paradoxa]